MYVYIYIYNTYTYIYICDMLCIYRFTQFEYSYRLIATCLSWCLLHLISIYIYTYTYIYIYMYTPVCLLLTPLLSSRYLDILCVFHNFSMHLNLDSDLLSNGCPRRSNTRLIKSTYLMWSMFSHIIIIITIIIIIIKYIYIYQLIIDFHYLSPNLMQTHGWTIDFFHLSPNCVQSWPRWNSAATLWPNWSPTTFSAHPWPRSGASPVRPKSWRPSARPQPPPWRRSRRTRSSPASRWRGGAGYAPCPWMMRTGWGWGWGVWVNEITSSRGDRSLG